MSHVSVRTQPAEIELAGRAEWLGHALEAARRDGRVICAAERAVMERYVRGEITGDEAREEILRIFDGRRAS
ncbi:MAG TPA: antitoxin VbhA family protein [Stellaceae bacterium]|nr:antitoxin VbhA family protein [Stellaceae bacterium]